MLACHVAGLDVRLIRHLLMLLELSLVLASSVHFLPLHSLLFTSLVQLVQDLLFFSFLAVDAAPTNCVLDHLHDWYHIDQESNHCY